MRRLVAVLLVLLLSTTTTAQSTFLVDETGLISLEVPAEMFATGAEFIASGDLFAEGSSPFGFVISNTPTKVTLFSIPEVVLPAGTIPTEVTWSGSDDSLEVFLAAAEPRVAVCARILTDYLFGEVKGQACDDTTVNFGRVVQGDAESSLHSDLLNVHAFGGPFWVENVRVNGTAADVFGVPDFQEVTLENEELATFSVELDVEAAPGLYEGSIEFFSEGRSPSPWWDLFDVRAEILHPGDCNADGSVDANDLACVSTAEQRDAVLERLNTLAGDLDGNGDVSFPDFLTFSQHFGQDLLSYSDGNIDLQGGIDFADFLILSTNFGSIPGATAVPEPHAFIAIFLALVCLAEISRRRLHK